MAIYPSLSMPIQHGRFDYVRTHRAEAVFDWDSSRTINTAWSNLILRITIFVYLTAKWYGTSRYIVGGYCSDHGSTGQSCTTQEFCKQFMLCFVVVRSMLVLPIAFRVTSLALGQSYDCPSASEITLKDMGKCITSIRKYRSSNHNKTKHSNTICIFYGIHMLNIGTIWNCPISECFWYQETPPFPFQPIRCFHLLHDHKRVYISSQSE